MRSDTELRCYRTCVFHQRPSELLLGPFPLRRFFQFRRLLEVLVPRDRPPILVRHIRPGEPVHQHVFDAVLSGFCATGVEKARAQLKEHLPKCEFPL